MKFWKKPKINYFLEYKRFVNSDGPDEFFLDIDTMQTISYRDEIGDLLLFNKLSQQEVAEIPEIDSIFRKRSLVSYENYKNIIAENKDETAEYIRSVMIDLKAFGKDEPIEKWWFHLFD